MANIAVVDDVPTNRELLATVLKALGHRVIEAADGVAALALVRREAPDLVICDILMPEVDGYEFVRQLRADPAIAKTPVIFYTAYYLEAEARQLAQACGVAEILTKPSDPEDIIAVVKRVLSEAAEAGQAEAPTPPEFDRQHLQLITGKLSEKVAELQCANDKLQALIALNLQLASQRDTSQLLDHVCTSARQLIGAEYGSIAVRVAGSDALAYVGHCGVDPAVVAAMGPLHFDAGVAGEVYRSQQVQRLELSEGQDALSGLPAGYPPLHSLIAAPVTSLTSAYGWICLGNKVGETGFTDADEELLRILAAQVGRIYENGSLYRRVQAYACELEAEIVDRERAQRQLAAQYTVARILDDAGTIAEAAPLLLEVVCSELEFAAGALWSVDEPGQMLRCLEAWCQPDDLCSIFVANTRQMTFRRKVGIPGRVWASGAPVWLSDLQAEPDVARSRDALQAGFRSGGAFPIVVRGRVAGIIEFFSRKASGPDTRLAETLTALGGQIGQFFERNAQQQRIVRLTRVYAVLSGINSTIVRNHDRKELFGEACRIAVQQGEFGIAWIGEFDPEAMELIPVAWAGIDEAQGTERLSVRSDSPFARQAVGRAVLSGIPVFINDLSKVSEAGSRCAEALRRGYQSLIALPLVVEEKVVGVMVLYAREPDFFTGEELELLTELANDVSFALEYIGKQDLLAYLAYHDVLTGLSNRAHLLESLGQALQTARKHPGEKVAVVLWNVNRFRNINDTFGRQVGDRVLREVAQRFMAAWPDGTSVARIAGDQFAAIHAGGRELTEIAHSIENAAAGMLKQPIVVGEHELRLSMSAGVAVFSGGDEDADTLVKNAEVALRKAKGAGLGFLFYGPEMNALIAETLILENRLRQALERDEFVLYYQPKTNGASGRVTGLEALIRWNDPEGGVVQPGVFIPILEETGMILEVGAWAIRKALADMQKWRIEGIDPPRVAVNVSAIQLQQKDFVDSVRLAIKACNGEAPSVDLEITESMLMTDLDDNILRLSEIRGLGLDIAIDDFGTGYSSLGYLSKLPVNALKIDKSFIDTMAATPESMTIVSTIISLAHSLGLKVIAEGVEKEEQAKFLRLFRCNELQGYLISQPLPPDEVVGYLRDSLASVQLQ
ncbi:EAL domain-containing protein [Aromatoleum diolicum]|uniref:EAL domain-containing protein n=1 Tax=Aromatoleum diolicum TaxID=75796 RepID=A0ABX1QHH5_9RHOO|nr:EAL domain-containing protein [Aromatoleum diolicum]NMG76891.1 EAL domain-containing protein [Aromatoleum diolicum]